MKNQVLLLIVALAAFLRLWGLGVNPPHLTNDEAALGYNAYSILKTGRDEHGAFLPLVFQSFGDWKPGLYVYLDVPFVAAFGLNEFSVRVVSALCGILSVWLIFLLGTMLFKSRSAGLFSAFFMAVFPISVHLSRGAWEANVSLTLLLAGVYFFLRYLDGKPKSIVLSAIFFALTLWTYQGAKLSTLIVAIVLGFTHWKKIVSIPKRSFITALLVGGVLIAPLAVSLVQGKAGRLEVFSVFSYKRPEKYVQDILVQGGEATNSLSSTLYHSESLAMTRGIIERWLNHFSGRFLFFEGDWTNPRHGAPDVGIVLLADSLFIASGFLVLARTKYKKAALFVFAWFLLAPLPAALSRDTVHAVRSFNMIAPLSLIAGLGASFLLQGFYKKWPRYLPVFCALCAVAYLLNYTYFLDQYWVHYPKRDAKYWMYGYEQVAAKIASHQQDYKHIVFQQSYNQPYIFFLFEEKYDPAKFQEVSRKFYEPNKFGDVGLISHLDNIEFRDATAGDLHKKDTLIIYDPEHPPFAELSQRQPDGSYEEIKRPDGSTAFEMLSFK